MTEIVVNIESTLPQISPWIKDMEPGEVWAGRTEMFGHQGVFLRTYNSLVLLDSPRTTWDLPTSGAHVRIIGRPIKKLTIIAE